MKRYQILAVILSCVFLPMSVLVFLGCEVGSSDSVTRNVTVDFTGFYDSTATNNDFVSPANSGARVTSLNLRQSGDQLEAVDNNGIIFNGTLSDSTLNSGTATANFELNGRTTVGQSVTISGSLSGSGTSGNMRGTWIEPERYCYVVGDAEINEVRTNQPTAILAISPSGVISMSLNSTRTFTRQNGTGPFSWSISRADLGQLSATTGDSVIYQANGTIGTNTITVSDSTSASASATIYQQ